MKKIYFLTMALICACVANAAGIINIYVKKSAEFPTVNLYAWTSSGELLSGWPGTKFTESATVDGVEYWKMAVDTGSSSTWNLIFNDGSKQTVDMKGPASDSFYELSAGGSKGLVATAITGMNPNATGIYLKGNEINSWNVDPNYEFQKTDTENVYTLTNVVLCGFFKIGDADWSKINIGASETSSIVKIGEAATLSNNNESKNLYTDGTYLCDITLNMAGEAPVVTITGERTASGVYLKGEMNSWSDNADWQFNSLGAGFYELKKYVLATDGAFKVYTNGFWYGLPGENEPITAVYGTNTLADGKNMVLPEGTVAEKFIFNISENNDITLTITEATTDLEGIFLRGNVNNWATDSAWQFIETATPGIYELKDVKLQGFFKIADALWKDVNVGSVDGSAISVGNTVYLVNGGESQNICLDGTYQCSLITLDLTGDSPALTIVGEATTSGIFIYGDMNAWGEGDNVGEYEFTDYGAGYYAIDEKPIRSTDGQFKIYNNGTWLGAAGSDNAETVELVYGDSYTLVDGVNFTLPENTITTYIELFVDANGEATLMIEGTENSGVAETLVDTDAAVEYFNLQGIKVANPENGIFIKKQGSKVVKVVL